MDLADANDFSHDQPAQRHHQGRSQVNGEKTQAAVGGQPDAAVKSPGRAVYCQRKGIDVRIADNAPPGICPFVAIIGNHKKKADVGKKEDDSGL